MDGESKKKKVCLGFSLSNANRAASKGSLVSKGKITIYLNPIPGQTAAPSKDYIKLSFREGQGEFFSNLEQCIKNKAWVIPEKVEKKKVFSTRGAGIGGIMKNIEKKQRSADKALNVAFSDLDSLMANAKELVTLAERYTKESDENKKDEFNSLLHNMGIASPVTRSSAGAAYHYELARQLADFITETLERRGGMMTLTDLFCIFNRARGTELVSPDDLLHACELFSELKIPLKLRRFKTGVMVLQSGSASDDSFIEKVLELLKNNATFKTNGISAADVSQKLRCSIILAKEHLLSAEQNLHLCRDDPKDISLGTSGLTFYPNFFLDEE